MTIQWIEDSKMKRIYELIALGVLLSSISRGFDYIHRPSEALPFTQGVESAAPLWIWGGLLLCFGLLGLCGELWYALGSCKWRWMPSFIAHSGLSAILTVIGISITFDGMLQGWGWASGVNLIVFGYIHLLCSYRRSAIK